jgi:hypothetical protein
MNNKPNAGRAAKARAKKAKATKAIVARRVEEVLRIRLDGAEFWDVREYAREKEQEAGSAWELPKGGKPLSDGQLWRYIGMADKLIAESCRAHRKKLLRRHLAQRRNLFAKAVSQGDVRAALACLDSEAKLTGLFDDEVTRLIDQMQKQIAELKARHGNSNHSPATAGDGSGPENAPSTGEAAASGTNPPRSSAGDESTRLVGGSVASEAPAHELEESVAPLFPSERQEPGRGSAGVG